MKTLLTFLLAITLFSCSTPEMPQELRQEVPNYVVPTNPTVDATKNQLIIVSDYDKTPTFTIRYNNVGAYFNFNYDNQNRVVLNVNDKIVINWIDRIDYNHAHTTNIRFNDKLFTIVTPKGEQLIFEYIITPQDIKN